MRLQGGGPHRLTQISPAVRRRCQEEELDDEPEEVAAVRRGALTWVSVDRRGSRSRDIRYRLSSLRSRLGSSR